MEFVRRFSGQTLVYLPIGRAAGIVMSSPDSTPLSTYPYYLNRSGIFIVGSMHWWIFFSISMQFSRKVAQTIVCCKPQPLPPPRLGNPGNPGSVSAKSQLVLEITAFNHGFIQMTTVTHDACPQNCPHEPT